MRLQLALLSLALPLAGCTAAGIAPSRALGQAGAAADDHSACNEIPQSPADPTLKQNASAEGGQRNTYQPTQDDPGARNINTVWARGGPASSTPTSTDTKSQATGPAVNQGLILPTSATNGANPADNPAVAAITARLAMLRAQYATALSHGQPDLAASIATQMDGAEARLTAAVSASVGEVTNNFNFQNSVNTQTVGAGSHSGGDGSDPVSTTRGLKSEGPPAGAVDRAFNGPAKDGPPAPAPVTPPADSCQPPAPPTPIPDPAAMNG